MYAIRLLSIDVYINWEPITSSVLLLYTGPECITEILSAVAAATGGQLLPVWIDMESSLRATLLAADGTKRDVFAVERCFRCILAGLQFGLRST